MDSNGQLRIDIKEMKNVVEEAFSKIFASDGPDDKWRELWEEYGHLLKGKVLAEQKAVLEQDITVQELREALSELPTGKSPGHDGTTKEFFTLFWAELQGLVLGAVQAAWEKALWENSSTRASFVCARKRGI